MAQTALTGVMQRPGVRQFVKFCVVGFTSTLVDAGVASHLTFGLHWNWIIARTISFTLAVTNGFVWNSVWTFKGLGSGKHHEMYAKFFAVNVVGYLLNIAIMQSVFFALTGSIHTTAKPDKLHWAAGFGIAVIFVSLWNFWANKHWTYRGERPPAS